MAATTQRWAIAPPALDEETDELEGFPESNGEAYTNVIERRALEGSDDPQVTVEGSPSGWLSHDHTPQGARTEIPPRAQFSVPPDDESFDTIPAPTWLGDD